MKIIAVIVDIYLEFEESVKNSSLFSHILSLCFIYDNITYRTARVQN